MTTKITAFWVVMPTVSEGWWLMVDARLGHVRFFSGKVALE
jgi:hypothetical protein